MIDTKTKTKTVTKIKVTTKTKVDGKTVGIAQLLMPAASTFYFSSLHALLAPAAYSFACRGSPIKTHNFIC